MKKHLAIFLMILTLLTPQAQAMLLIDYDPLLELIQDNTSTYNLYNYCLAENQKPLSEKQFKEFCTIATSTSLCRGIPKKELVNCNDPKQNKMDLSPWDVIWECGQGILLSLWEFVKFIYHSIEFVVDGGVQDTTESINAYVATEFAREKAKPENKGKNDLKIALLVAGETLKLAFTAIKNTVMDEVAGLGCYNPETRLEKMCTAIAGFFVPPAAIFKAVKMFKASQFKKAMEKLGKDSKTPVDDQVKLIAAQGAGQKKAVAQSSRNKSRDPLSASPDKKKKNQVVVAENSPPAATPGKKGKKVEKAKPDKKEKVAKDKKAKKTKPDKKEKVAKGKKAKKAKPDKKEKVAKGKKAKKKGKERSPNFNADPNKEPWKILGVTANATKKQIQDAYIKLSKIYHTDTGSGSLEKMKLINAAKDAMDKKTGSGGGGQPAARSTRPKERGKAKTTKKQVVKTDQKAKKKQAAALPAITSGGARGTVVVPATNIPRIVLSGAKAKAKKKPSIAKNITRVAVGTALLLDKDRPQDQPLLLGDKARKALRDLSFSRDPASTQSTTSAPLDCMRIENHKLQACKDLICRNNPKADICKPSHSPAVTQAVTAPIDCKKTPKAKGCPAPAAVAENEKKYAEDVEIEIKGEDEPEEKTAKKTTYKLRAKLVGDEKKIKELGAGKFKWTCTSDVKECENKKGSSVKYSISKDDDYDEYDVKVEYIPSKKDVLNVEPEEVNISFSECDEDEDDCKPEKEEIDEEYREPAYYPPKNPPTPPRFPNIRQRGVRLFPAMM